MRIREVGHWTRKREDSRFGNISSEEEEEEEKEEV